VSKKGSDIVILGFSHTVLPQINLCLPSPALHAWLIVFQHVFAIFLFDA
jgi:hypothetical protein